MGNGNGMVSYLEIMMALQPTDTALGGRVRFDLFEQICRTVWLHKEALLQAFHDLDTGHLMRLTSEELTRALQQLNTLGGGVASAETPLLASQIEILVSHVKFDTDQRVDYAKFLDSFFVDAHGRRPRLT